MIEYDRQINRPKGRNLCILKSKKLKIENLNLLIKGLKYSVDTRPS